MRNIFSLLICLFVQSCQSQKVYFDIKSYDIILFELMNNETIIPKKFTKSLLVENDFHVTSSQWRALGGSYGNNYVLLNSSRDTMNIKCFCRQENNLFFKNITFRKGNYELSFKKPNEKIKGKEIKTSMQMQNIIFKNAYSSLREPVFQDKYFQDLEFYEINLKDTINVKLKSIE